MAEMEDAAVLQFSDAAVEREVTNHVYAGEARASKRYSQHESSSSNTIGTTCSMENICCMLTGNQEDTLIRVRTIVGSSELWCS